jgi:hypothetical protein
MRVLHRPYSMHLQFMSLKGGCRRLPGARALLSELGQVVEGAAALYRRSLPMPNFHIRRGGRRIT